MSYYREKSAVVTGAASGIGLALSRALVERGARVWLADIDAAAAEASARPLGDAARPAHLDVRDGEAFARLVREVATIHGSIDLLFNNAGVGGAAGEAKGFSIEHYDQVVDINIRGVTNGIAAAYPLMAKQGTGHLVNTASAAGLLPVPLLAPYSMTKHAVVGLSESLRLEAELHGVRVSVLCPSAIDTPLLDSAGPADLRRAWRPDLRTYLTELAGAPIRADRFAEFALDALAKGKGRIVAPLSARLGWIAYRLVPGLAERRVRRALRAQLGARSGAVTEREASG